ncbi:hypothetical protein NQ317_001277 [Molorchus minor]|uniref:HD domain-containing protein n=1 Tax=Molorchus minor TaxID=1323400 RepID=A0ABQ9IPP8_9CUCU|nr:hypothetical protein NQ317_001277 [Molorchus minor]
MEALNPDSIIKFLNLVNNLKHTSRRGWELCKIQNHEHIAGHMFKCLQLALVHDLAECIVGDITPKDNIPEDKKHAMEDEAMKELTAHVGSEIGPLIYNLYKEYEAKETPEAKFVKKI